MNVLVREYNARKDSANFVDLVRGFYSEQRKISNKSAFSVEEAKKSVKKDFAPSSVNAVFVAESGGKIIGFARLKKDEGAWFLKEISVAKSERRKGVGSLLMSNAVDFLNARNEKAFYLSVVPNNSEALGFFKRKGINRLNTVELESRLDGKKHVKSSKVVFKGNEFDY